MSGYVPDWGALATFFGPVVAVGLGAWVAAWGYRKQKLLDRRTDWYEGMILRLHAAHGAYRRAAFRDGDSVKAFQVLDDAVAYSLSGQFYVEARGHAALQAFLDRLTTFDVDLGEAVNDLYITAEESLAITQICADLSAALTAELRGDFGLDTSLPSIRIRKEPGLTGQGVGETYQTEG